MTGENHRVVIRLRLPSPLWGVAILGAASIPWIVLAILLEFVK